MHSLQEREFVMGETDLVSVTIQARPTAISAGHYRVAVSQEVDRVISESHGNLAQAMEVGLERLKVDGLITPQEQTILGKICELVFESGRGKIKPDEASTQVHTIYSQLLVDSSTSPIALAIASVASSGPIAGPPVTTSASGGVVVELSTSDAIDTAMVGGAIIGAGVGALIGGFPGAVIGAIIGGAVGGCHLDSCVKRSLPKEEHLRR